MRASIGLIKRLPLLSACLTCIATSTTRASEVADAARGVGRIVAHRGASIERPECTMASIQRAIEVGATAVEIDVRTSSDGVLFLLHDATLDRTTNGHGPASRMTMEQLKQLDSGLWFDAAYKGERIPTLREALEECRGQIDVLLDLKEQGDTYAEAVVREVRYHGDETRTIVGVRSVTQARRFRQMLPNSTQLGLIPDPASIEAFVEAGVETIRLWPRWLASDGIKLVQRVRRSGALLHLNGSSGTAEETIPLLKYNPDSLSSDDPARLLQTLAELAGPVEVLPGTEPIEWREEDLSKRLMDGAHRFVEREIRQSVLGRRRFWDVDRSSPVRYAQSVEPNRRRLRNIIGAVDPRPSIRMERFGNDDDPSLVAETVSYRVFQVRWSVLDGLSAEGLLVQPAHSPQAHIVVLPDADQTPEQLLGLASGIESQLQLARRLAENGFELLIPTLINRRRLETDDARLQRSDQTHREWIYRQAFHMGRHVIGYEVQEVMAAVDWFTKRVDDNRKIGVVGYGEGGLIALYAAALDTRINAALASGYFDSRKSVWSEPIYRNVWGLLREFGDAEIADLIAPRGLIIEYSPVPEVQVQKGHLATPPLQRVQSEVARVSNGLGGRQLEFVHGQGDQPVGPGSEKALAAMAARLGLEKHLTLSSKLPKDRRTSFSPADRHARVWKQMENHVQSLVRNAEHVRDKFYLHAVLPQLAEQKWSTQRRHPVHPVEEFTNESQRYRQLFHEEAMGKFDEPLLPANARTRKIIDNDRWTAYDVVLDVYPELFAWGVLVLPNDIAPGERRPVVVCQHGRNGVPRDTIDRDVPAYNNFAARLAEQGFITFAPHNLYRGEDRYRWLDRKANTIKATLFSFIISQHDQILRWLDSLPFVDGDRIAFYGLSYGGETAMRVPTVLDKYCLSICSGDFNQWTRKVASTDQPFSFMRTIEWEMPYWNLGHTFDYAEMAYLMIPRPFMVERGHLDRVGRDRWVAHEYAKVRFLYTQLDLANRTEIGFFQGGHSINGERTFEFLRNHLDWPARE